MGDVHGVVGVIIIIAAVIGGLIAIGGGGALVYGAFDRQAREALRQDNQDFKNRQETLEHRVQTLELELGAEKRENRRLREMITQRARVDEVLSEVRNHAAAAERWWEKLGSSEQAIEELLTALLGSVNHLAEEMHNANITVAREDSGHDV